MAVRKFLVGDRQYQCDFERNSDGLELIVNARDCYQIAQVTVSSDQKIVFFTINDRAYKVLVKKVPSLDGSGYVRSVFIAQLGRSVSVEPVTSGASAQKKHTFSGAAAIDKNVAPLNLKSPLAGRINKILVAPGQSVSFGQPLVRIESMKMENEICATSAAIIKTIFIDEGNVVQQNQILMDFEKRGDDHAAPKNQHEQKAVSDR